MSCEPAPPFEALSRLSWRTLVVTLQNIRAERAVEHPLAVFQGLLRFAAAAASGPLPDFFFHPLGGPLPTRMRRGRYRLEVVFPDGPPDELHRFVDALSHYMILGGRNFRLIDIEPPRLRTLEAVTADFPDIRPGLGELCLDFQTPFPFTRPTNRDVASSSAKRSLAAWRAGWKPCSASNSGISKPPSPA